MADFQIAELVKSTNMYELACKTSHKMSLTAEEKDTVEQLDAYFKEVGRRGVDPEHEIAAFITRTINEEIYNAPDELLDYMFDRSSITMDDDFNSFVTPKNTLVAYEAAYGGNVERSYLDVSILEPKWKNIQIETDIQFAELERNGWKTVALVTEYAVAAFKNKMFAMLFDVVDSAIVSGADNYIPVTAALPTEAAMQQLALYLNDRAEDEGVAVGRSKYVQAVSLFNSFISEDMKNEVNRTGRLGTYMGISLIPISSAKKLGDGSGLIMDKRIFGIAGKIGSLVMKGDIKTYQTMDPDKESVHLMFKNFTFGYAFNNDTLDNVVKVVLE